MHSSSPESKTYGEPDQWEFDYPWEIVQTAFWLWSMSGFQKLPTQEEVMSYDPRFISDLRLAHQIYSHQGNTSVPMKLLENWEAYNQSPQMYKANQEFDTSANESDASPNLDEKNLGKRSVQGNRRLKMRGGE